MKFIKTHIAGFTRSEVLVVLVSVLLLIAVVLPALSEARRPNLRILCAMNMKTMGQGMAQYASEQRAKLPVQRYYPSGSSMTTTVYDCKYVKDPAKRVGPITLAASFGLGGLYDTGLLTRHEVFFCPGVTEANAPEYYPDYYSHPRTGDLWSPEAPDGQVYRIRSTYNFFKNNILTIDKMAGLSYLYDFVDFWQTIPHKTIDGTPEGMNVLYGDGRVVFNTDPKAFDKDLWGDGMGNNSPANNLDMWYQILNLLGNNMPDLSQVAGGSMSNWVCNDYQVYPSGPWFYSPAP